MLVFIIEHIMLLVGLLIVAAVPAVPQDVQEQIDHRAFVLARDARVLRLKQMVTKHTRAAGKRRKSKTA
jgi:hypothetical protein